MDTTPKHLNALLVELRKIRGQLATLGNDLNQRCEAIFAAYERGQQQRHELPIPFEIKLEKDQETRRAAESDRQHRVQNSARKATWLTFVATSCAFVAAAIYAWEANRQLNEMALAREQIERTVSLGTGQLAVASRNAKTAELAMRIEQRAWLRPSIGAATYSLNSPVEMPMTIENTGKTPAKHVVAVIAVWPLDVGQMPDFSYEGKHVTRTGGDAFFPGLPANFKVVLTPEAGKVSTAIILDNALYSEFIHGKKAIIQHGKITFKDVFNVEHWVTFCMMMGGPAGHLGQEWAAAEKRCIADNDFDTN